ncbi:uncharacterized protein [Littorina saxatilis]|uniref:uncharacterized protein n=1 Tax=Littorina saxatilis TaxID=31220 RepID=UPI0038B5AF4F
MTHARIVGYISTFLWILNCCHGDKISGVCTDITNPPVNQAARPDIPDQFHVVVECSLLDQNKTTVVTEWYDFTSNLAHVTQQDEMEYGDLFFDYKNNELLNIDRYSDGACKVSTLADNPNNYLFGIKVGPSGQEHVLDPPSALHFGNVSELYLGNNHSVRGIVAEAWTSCQYSEDLDATMNVTWYFSANTTWDMQLGVSSVPIRADVMGKRNNAGGGNHDFHHIYDLFDFTPSVKPSDFQLQPGDYCPGRLNTKPFPTLPKVFSIIGEILDFDSEQVETIEEHYDSYRKLTVYKYKEGASLSLLSGANGRTEVNDFQEGYAYIIDNDAGSCQVHLISEGQFAFVDETGSGTKVRQQTPAEFFLATNVTWEYGGVKNERGIDCDTWVGKTDQAKSYKGINVTIEWAFATTDAQDWNVYPELLEQTQTPIRMRLWTPNSDGDAGVTYEYNAFAFTSGEPQISTIDISSCFHGVQRANLRFDIDSSYSQTVTQNVMAFKAALMDSISIFVGISSLRTSDIKLYTTATAITVSLDMVDKPAFVGDSAQTFAQNSLADALSLLLSRTVENAIQFRIIDGRDAVSIKPQENSVRVLFTNGTCVGNCPVHTTSGTGANTGTGTTPGTGTQTITRTTLGTGTKTVTQTTPGTGTNTVTQTTPGTGAKTVTQTTPGTGTNTVTQTTPGTGTKTVTQTTPGTGTKTVTQTTPGTGTKTVTQTTPGTGTNTGRGTTPGTGTHTSTVTGTNAGHGDNVGQLTSKSSGYSGGALAGLGIAMLLIGGGAGAGGGFFLFRKDSSHYRLN